MVEPTPASDKPQFAEKPTAETIAAKYDLMEKQMDVQTNYNLGLEATEEIFPSLLELQKRKYTEFVTGADVYVPEVILDRPNRRLIAIEGLRDELL